MGEELSTTKLPHNWTDAEPTLSPAARQLLEVYAKIQPDQTEDHVKKIREEAFAIHPYPCIGNFRFLDLSLFASKIHDEVITRVRDGARFLDLGCCFGQEVRYLVSKGCPAENIYGADLRPAFIDFGYELFRDKDTLKATFLTPFDIFSTEPSIELDGKMDIVNASSFFHLFSLQDSIAVAKKVVGFLKPVTGSLVVGRQVGSRGEAGPKDAHDGKLAYRHNADSWRKMWNDVGAMTSSEWDVDFWWDPARGTSTRDGEKPDANVIQRFYYIVRRR